MSFKTCFPYHKSLNIQNGYENWGWELTRMWGRTTKKKYYWIVIIAMNIKKVRQCWWHSLQSHLGPLQQIRPEVQKHEDCISCTRSITHSTPSKLTFLGSNKKKSQREQCPFHYISNFFPGVVSFLEYWPCLLL